MFNPNDKKDLVVRNKEMVLVKWRDIIAYNGWEQAGDVSCPELFSLGWLVKQDQDTVMIANTLDYDDFTGEGKTDPPIPYGITAFPKGCVISITRILA